MQTRIKNHYGLRRRGDGYGQKKCLSFGLHELGLMEYSEDSAEKEGMSWSGKIKKLIKDDREKKEELSMSLKRKYFFKG